MAEAARPDLATRRRVHVIGAGGSGMSAIANVLLAMGHAVTASDAADSRALRRLASAGATVYAGHDPVTAAGAELVVRSTAVADSDPEVDAARRAGLTVWRRADVLAAICARRRTIAVSGTHGKTTTSAMLATAMLALGWHPSFIVGGEIRGIGSGSAWDPEGESFVVEADESDGTFVELGAEAVVVTSVEADHLEFYGGMGGLEAAFERFVADASGAAVLCADDPGALRLAGYARRPVTYGTGPGAAVRISDVRLSRSEACFTLSPGGGPGLAARSAVPGLHNVRNATAAATVLAELGAPWEEAVEAVATFSGVGRRFESRGRASGVDFVDGYDHLPTELAAALATARAGGWSRVVVVFQPHRYSRTEAQWRQLGTAVADADVVVVTDVYPAGEAPRPGVTGELVYRAAAEAGTGSDVRYAPTLEEAAEVVSALLRPGDVCLTLGAGDVTNLAELIMARLEGER